MNILKVYKVGGGILSNSNTLKQFLIDFSSIKENKILVHGGGKGANQLLKKLGIISNIINGRRVTDIKTLEVLISFYSGTLNKKIVVELQKFGCNAIGLSGCDANSVSGILRSPINEINFGYVGDLHSSSINSKFIKLLLLNNIVPVFSPIIHDKNGNLLNTNADTIAGYLAQTFVNDFEVELHFCFDKIGVLREIDDEKSLIPLIKKKDFLSLINNNIIHSGMIPKLENAFLVIEKGVKKVFLQHPKNIKNSIYTCCV